MSKIFDVFMGRLDGWHTYRAMQNINQEELDAILKQGYRVETEHQIGSRLHEVYLVKD